MAAWRRKRWSRTWWSANSATRFPLHRQVQMIKRQGITLDRSTLSAWVGRACWWLTPLYELVLGSVLSSDKVFADETTLPVLDPGRGKTKTGQLWCYAVDDRPWAGPTHPAVAYVYCDGRHGEHPIAHLAAFQGILQVDGYAGYGKLVKARTDGSIQLAYCWVHARRLFYEFYTSSQHHNEKSRITLSSRARSPPPCERPPSATQSAAGRGPAALAAGAPAAPAWLVGPGKSHALCPGTLGWADPVPRRRSPGDGHEHSRACHSSDNDYQEKQFIRRFRRWSPSLGDRQHIDPVLQTQRR